MLDVGMGYVSLSLHLVQMLFGMPSLHPFTFLMFLLPLRIYMGPDIKGQSLYEVSSIR